MAETTTAGVPEDNKDAGASTGTNSGANTTATGATPTPQAPKPKAPSPAAMARRTPHPAPSASSAAPATPAAATAQPAAVSPTEWGRIDADGTVFVRTADGEREIGQWQAGTPEEGLAHYAARFDDLATEVSLLAARLNAHPEDADAIRKTAEEARAGLTTAAAIGDLAALEHRLTEIIGHVGEAKEQLAHSKAERREAAIAAKEKLLAEAEELAANSTDWKAAGDRIRAILEEWRTIRGIDRTTDNALWKRYSVARDSFNRRRGSHFADLDRQRLAAKRAKEQLVERAQALSGSREWNETARAFRDLMQEWKAAGRAAREVDNRLWAQFKAAQDAFFDARNALNEERDRELAANAAAKDALLAEYSPLIDPAKNLDQARARLTELQEKWEEIGYVPRGQVRAFEDKIAAVEKRVADAEESQWKRTDPEAQARAAQFQAKVAEFTEQANAAEAKGKADRAAELRAQAAQWQEWADAAYHAVEDR